MSIPVHSNLKRSDQTTKHISEPANFKVLVELLVASGGGQWSQEDCEKALRVSLYNSDRAYEFLNSGHIPDQPTAALATKPDVSSTPLSFSEEEKQAINRIKSKCNCSFLDAAQFYEACDKDEQKAIEIIASSDLS